VQTSTATLDDAIEAGVREPLVRVRVDWDRSGSFTDLAVKDLSADVEHVSLSRELETDLPEQAKLFAGSAAAEVTVTLRHQPPEGAPEQHGAWYYSQLNTASPLFSYDRKAAPAVVEVGFLTEAGQEYLEILTGTVRSLEPTSGARTATLVIADGAEQMRGQLRLPPIIADGATETTVLRPGLNSTFLADWILRRYGWYASPPKRTGCVFLASQHGSGWPEVGVLEEHHGAFGSKLSYSPTPTFPTPARWVQGVNLDGSTGQALRYFLDTSVGVISTNNTRTALVQGWFKFNSTASDQPLWIIFGNTATTDPFFSLTWTGGNLQLLFNRSGADVTNRAIIGPAVSPGTSAWHYIAVLVSFTSTGVTATFRYDSTTTGPTTTATPSVTNSVACNRIQVGRGRVAAYADGRFDGVIEDPQATTESTIGAGWDNAFTPTAEVHASPAVDNRLVACPIVSEEGWAVLQELAKADFATASFREDGVPVWWPRDRWTTAPYTTSQVTLSAEREVAELALVEATDQVRNTVVIRAVVPQIGATKTVWKLASVVSIPAGSSRTIIADLQTPVGNVDTTVVSGTALGSSRYLAGDRADGLGNQVTNLTFVVTQRSPQTIKIVVTNPNGVRVYLTGDQNASTLYSGTPYLWIDAQPIIFTPDSDAATGDVRVEATDPASEARFGEYLWEAPPSEFRQDDEDLQGLADDLIVDLAVPPPAIRDVPILADPRLQLGDRATVTDPAGLAFTDDFHLSKVNLEVDPGEAMTMTVSLRGA
jgi:hypothetical protein